MFCLFAWLQFNIASSNIPSHFKKDSFKFYFVNILNFLTDSDDSNAEDGPSEADSLKGPLREADEKSRLVDVVSLQLLKRTGSIQNCKTELSSVSMSIHT